MGGSVSADRQKCEPRYEFVGWDPVERWMDRETVAVHPFLS